MRRNQIILESKLIPQKLTNGGTLSFPKTEHNLITIRITGSEGQILISPENKFTEIESAYRAAMGILIEEGLGTVS